MYLMDQWETQIKCVAYTGAYEKFHPMNGKFMIMQFILFLFCLQGNDCYDIAGYSIQKANKTYDSSNHTYQMALNTSSKVTKTCGG